MTTLLGIDIGGSGIKGAPVDTRTGEEIAARYRIPTPPGATPTAVTEVVGALAEHFDWTGRAGVTFPAVVRDGTVCSAVNVDPSWIGTDAAALFSEETGAAVTVLNDADAAGIAEMRFGAGVGRSGTVIVLTLGTGVGSAVFTDGVLVPNSELGQLEIRGKRAELRVAASARERKDLTWKQWAKRLNEYFATLELLLSPELLVIGGGASKRADEFLEYLHADAEIVPAKLRNEAGIVGAALAAAAHA